MGFNTEIGKALDDQLPINRRFVALRSALQRFCPGGFNATLTSLEQAVGVVDPTAWKPTQVAEAAERLRASRAHYLRHRAEWDRARAATKATGRPEATPAEQAAFETPAWFDEISQGRRRRYHWAHLEDWVRSQGVSPGPFGVELAAEANAVLDRLPATDIEPRGTMLAHYAPFELLGRSPGHVIEMPMRVYNAPISDTSYDAMSEPQRLIVDCWYSRSFDGHVRQRHVRRLVRAEQPWVVPYVVAALGDYVVEIVEDVAAGLDQLDQPTSWQHRAYKDFAGHNHDLIELTRQRAASYRYLYYTASYAAAASPGGRPVYPAFSVLDELGVTFPRFYRRPSGS